MNTVGDAGSETRFGVLGGAIRRLHPGYFAFVMATGIISTGMLLEGSSWISRALLALAGLGFVVLSVALVLRLIFFRSSVVEDVRAPERVFGFFTIVAGTDVLGVRLDLAGHPRLTAVLATGAALVWVALTYGVPASVVLARRNDSALRGVNGSWLVWVVATQSLSIASSSLATVWPSQSALLAPVSVAMWSVGLVLYLLVIALIVTRWLSVTVTPGELGPTYWVLMGATAITVLAGAHIMEMPHTLAIYQATAGFVEGFSFALWAFGTWWVPFLLILGFWRHVRRHWTLAYEPSLWSMVFPLGMYAVATLTFGKAAGLAFMDPLSRVMIWVAVIVWVVVAAAFVVQAATSLRQRAAVTPPTP